MKSRTTARPATGHPIMRRAPSVYALSAAIVGLALLFGVGEPRAQAPIELPTRTDSWMGDYGDVIGQRLLKQVVFPGTHDSATYDLVAPPAIKKWAQTQDKTILQQLNEGVRSFDLRFGWDWHDQEIRVAHGIVWGHQTVDDILQQLTEFLGHPAHTKEIVIIQLGFENDLAQQNAFGAQRRDQVFDAFARTLGDRLVANIPSNLLTTALQTLTVNDLWSSDKQVVVLSNHTCAENCETQWRPWHQNSALFGAYTNVYYPDGSTPLKTYDENDLDDLDVVKERMELAIRNRHWPKMLVHGTAITPNAGFIVSREAECIFNPAAGCSLLQIGEQAKRLMDDALAWWANNDNSARKNMNIFGVDAYQHSNVVPYAILMNAGPVQWVGNYRNFDGSVYSLSTWRGGAVLADFRCGTEPVVNLPPPVQDLTTGSTIRSQVVRDSAGLETTVDVTRPVPVLPGRSQTAECEDEYGKIARLNLASLPTLSRFTFGDLPPTVTAGQTLTMVTAHGSYSNGDVLNISHLVKFTVKGPSGTERECDGNVCRFTEIGANRVTASTPAGMTLDGSVRSSAAILTVTLGPPTAIALSPSSSTMVAGATQPYTVIASDTYGNQADVTGLTSVYLGTLPCPAAKCTTTKAGTYVVTAIFNNTTSQFSAQTSLRVTPGPIATVPELSPPNATIGAGGVQPYLISAADEYGNTVTLPPSVLTIAPVAGGGGSTTGAFCANGTCTATVPGTYTVTALHFVLGVPMAVTAQLVVTGGSSPEVAATFGSGQSAIPDTDFESPLVATVTSAAGNPVPGATVTFVVTSGSAAFPGGVAVVTVTANNKGVATAPALTAGPSLGPVVVTASSDGGQTEFILMVVSSGPARADLSLQLGAPSTAQRGAVISVTMTVKNAGPSAADKFGAALLVPRGFVVTNLGGGTKVGSLVLFRGTSLASGKSTTYTVTMRVDAKKNVSRLLAGIALSSTKDPSYRNNIAGTLVRVR